MGGISEQKWVKCSFEESTRIVLVRQVQTREAQGAAGVRSVISCAMFEARKFRGCGLITRAVKFSYTWGLLLKYHSVKFPSKSQSVRELDGPGDDSALLNARQEPHVTHRVPAVLRR